MGSEMAKKYGAQGRGDVWKFDPDDLTLVVDEAHPLYDERVHLPPDPKFVANVAAFGVKIPIQFRFNGEIDGKPVVEVVDGRQRVLAARLINERARKAGGETMMVQGVLWKGSDPDAAQAMVFLNEARRDDDLSVKMKKAWRLEDLGHEPERIALAFNRSVATVKRWLAARSLGDFVLLAIEREGLALDAALKLADMPRDRQAEALAEMRAQGGLSGQAAAEQAEEKAEKVTGKKKRKKKQKRSLKYAEIAAERTRVLKEEKNTAHWRGVVAGLSYALGDKDAYDDATGGE